MEWPATAHSVVEMFVFLAIRRLSGVIHVILRESNTDQCGHVICPVLAVNLQGPRGRSPKSVGPPNPIERYAILVPR